MDDLPTQGGGGTALTETSSALPTEDRPALTMRPRGEGIIGWFARNHVAANLMMFAIVAGGLYTIFNNLKKETMPSFSFDQIQVFVPFRGGTPEEVEEGVLIKIEEAVKTVEGTGDVRSSAGEGSGSVILEVANGYELKAVLDEVKLAVDSISSFPNETERPVIQQWQGWGGPGVLNVQVYGEIDVPSLRDLAEEVRNEILELPEVSQAELFGASSSEISIEISEANLQRYGLTLGGVAQTIRQWSVDVPGGGIQTEGGWIRVRATGQAHTGEEYKDINLISGPDGRLIKLGDIATVIDGYSESNFYALFNGKPSIGIGVDARDREDALKISQAVRNYVETKKLELPSSVHIDYFADSTYYLDDRLNMMIKNILLGVVLVFLLLGLFLHLKIAFWVCVGLPVAFLGAFWLLPFVGVTLNMISLFGFILVIGIVVDDAIIIGEAAFSETERYGYNTTNIVRGARRVAVPATFGVLTTVAAFAPLLLSTASMSIMFTSIVWVVILCLLFSLVESKLILPSHLALMSRSSKRVRRKGPADWMDSLLQLFIKKAFLPFLQFAIKFRYVTTGVFFALLFLTLGFYLSPFMKKEFFPSFENDFLRVTVNLMEGLPENMIVEVVEQITDAMHAVNEEIVAETGAPEPPIRHVFAWTNGETSGRLNAELAKPDDRTLTPTQIATRWREKVGEIAGTRELTFTSQQRFYSGAAVEFNLSGKNFRELDSAAEELAEHLTNYDGLFEIRTPISTGPEEIRLEVKPEGVARNLTLNSLARQVREAFLGVEAQRIQRGEQEFRVIVRYPKSERRSIGNLENMMVRLPDGTTTLFDSVAGYRIERGYGTIQRLNGKRTVAVTADADQNKVSPTNVVADVSENYIPTLTARYPSVYIESGGASRDQALAMGDLGLAMLIALVSIYALIAIPLKSYLQPIIIMAVIPFGLIGAVVGHVILDIHFNIASMFGCVALTGVVVNDSLILVHFVNRKRREEGASLLESILSAGKARLRAILLTSLTTFFGLVPILLETSLQAQIVIPMAVSLAFGIMFATVITLILVPCLLRIGGDLVRTRDADVIADPTFAIDSPAAVPVPTGG
ncbi:MAG: efflux RND transporter permease subunit [Gammaproteobacteria bacterium]|nr:efflux RND transporter permease subunit [Gammaproteobacteria bacterium]